LLLEVDSSGLPAEVEVRGATVDLPPLHARLVAEIKLLSPADRALFDLNEGFFRWTPVPGAAKYILSFGVVTDEADGRSTKVFGGFETEATTVCLGVTPDPNGLLGKLARELPPGRIGEWGVVALDAAGRKVGVAVVGPDRTFVVARGLERPR
jgi:hypothetical protein